MPTIKHPAFDRESYFIKENIGWGLTGFGVNYEIYDAQTREVLLLAESELRNAPLMQKLLSGMGWFASALVVRTATDDKPLLYIRRRHYALLATTEVFDGSGTRRVALFRERFFEFLGARFGVYGVGDRLLFTCVGNLFGRSYRMMNDQIPVGHVHQTWSGLTNEFLGVKEYFVLEIPRRVEAGSSLRPVLLAAALQSDMLKSGRGRNSGVDRVEGGFWLLSWLFD